MNELKNISDDPLFSPFATPFLERRIKKFLEEQNITAQDLNNGLLKKQLLAFLAVNTTECFRDIEVWLKLKEVISKNFVNATFIRSLHVGCSFGHEVYSFQQLTKNLAPEIETYSLGIDKDLEAIQKAKSKNIDFNDDLDLETRLKQLGIADKQLQINSDFLADDISTMQHHGKFDFLFIRNLLIYYKPEIQEEILKKSIQFLFPGGYLIIGKSESLPNAIQNKFKPISAALKIFQLKQ